MSIPRVAGSAQWARCPSCESFLYHKQLKRNLGVCPTCNFHFRLRVPDRIAQLLDPDTFEDLSEDIEPVDALAFVDSKPYPDRIAAAQRKSGHKSGATYGRGRLEGFPVVVAIIDFSFIGGSMSGAVGESITRAAELALEERTPLIVVSASGGARMQEGCVSLMQMVKTSQAVGRLHEEGILYISLLTDPTYGGVSASYATLGDVLVAEPGSSIGFAGPSVIEQTIRQKLPEGFQTAEFLVEHGMLDLVSTRENMRQELRKLIGMHAGGQGENGDLVAPGAEGDAPITDADDLTDRDPWEIVQLARHIERPHTLDYIAHAFEDFVELHGDRLYRDDASIVGGVGRIGEHTVVVIGHQKGATTNEMMERNFGMPHPEGYRKAMRLMRHAARFGMPVVTFVDTPGAYPGIEAEERGQSNAIAESIMEMSRLPIPMVTTVTGEGGSGGALALAAGDRVMMLENSYYSVISPEGCATILFKDAAAAPRAAAALRITARDLLGLRVMDAVVPEPADGAHTDPTATAANVRRAVLQQLDELKGVPGDELLRRRYERFRLFGTPGRQPTLPPIAAPIGET